RANVEAATLTALEKLPADRFASAAEFARALGDVSYANARVTATMTAASLRGAQPRPRNFFVVVAALGGLALGAGLLSLLRSPPPLPVTRYGLSLPKGHEPLQQWQGLPPPGQAPTALLSTAHPHDQPFCH